MTEKPMSANPNPTLEGTESPSQIEFFWLRYRSLVWTLVALVLAALGVNYAVKYFNQKQVDAEWAAFSSSVCLDDSYDDVAKARDSLAKNLGAAELSQLEEGLGKATAAQRPFFLIAIARRAVLASKWERAESALSELETKYPNHSLVRTSDYPVQVREEVKADPKVVASPNKKPELKPAHKGSAVAMIREQIAAAREYVPPQQFARVEVPADADKIKFEFSSGYGSIVIALMPQSPQHRDAIKKLAEAGHWKDVAVDEIKRASRFMRQPMELHFGFESTKDSDSSKWNTTEPSKHVLDFEANDLSHFAGAVSARNEANGKSCADRLWIAVDEAPHYDGDRVIVGYVVEGLDNLKRICEATLSAQDDERGGGKPTENIRITSVSVVAK
ncbi:MAG TPA: peptidylprolyl isomerase [Planctomycetota bacterium]